ncbi:MAG: hypothetical protein JSS13_05585 [Proteobacteria bacterium]|nr:hypothetical protein [Pseudomonadota bacterium]
MSRAIPAALVALLLAGCAGMPARNRQILWNLQGKLLRQDVIPSPPPASYRQLKGLQPAGS